MHVHIYVYPHIYIYVQNDIHRCKKLKIYIHRYTSGGRELTRYVYGQRERDIQIHM